MSRPLRSKSSVAQRWGVRRIGTLLIKNFRAYILIAILCLIGTTSAYVYIVKQNFDFKNQSIIHALVGPGLLFAYETGRDPFGNANFTNHVTVILTSWLFWGLTTSLMFVYVHSLVCRKTWALRFTIMFFLAIAFSTWGYFLMFSSEAALENKYLLLILSPGLFLDIVLSGNIHGGFNNIFDSIIIVTTNATIASCVTFGLFEGIRFIFRRLKLQTA